MPLGPQPTVPLRVRARKFCILSRNAHMRALHWCIVVRGKVLEATPGIEPGYTDLQSAASPLRHVASPFNLRLITGTYGADNSSLLSLYE